MTMTSRDLGEAIMETLREAADSTATDIVHDIAEKECQTWCEENLSDIVDKEVDRQIEKELERQVDDLDLSDAIDDAAKQYDYETLVRSAVEDAGIDNQVSESIISFLEGDSFNSGLDRIVIQRVDAALRDPVFVGRLAEAIRERGLRARLLRWVRAKLAGACAVLGALKMPVGYQHHR